MEPSFDINNNNNASFDSTPAPNINTRNAHQRSQSLPPPIIPPPGVKSSRATTISRHQPTGSTISTNTSSSSQSVTSASIAVTSLDQFFDVLESPTRSTNSNNNNNNDPLQQQNVIPPGAIATPSTPSTTSAADIAFDDDHTKQQQQQQKHQQKEEELTPPLTARSKQEIDALTEAAKDTTTKRINPIAVGGDNSISISDKKHNNKKKKKRRGFFRSLGYSKTNEPITWVSFVGAVLVTALAVTKGIILPTVPWCPAGNVAVTEDCPPMRSPVDVPALGVGAGLSGIFLVGAISIVMCPGALMNHPRRNKTLSLIAILLLAMSLMVLITPVIKRHYVLPYNSVSNYSLQTTVIDADKGTALLNWTNVYTPYYGNNNNNNNNNNGNDTTTMAEMVFMRVYAPLMPWEDEPSDFSPYEHFFYTDKTNDQLVAVQQGVSIIKQVTGLKDGKRYVFMLMPAKSAKPSHKPIELANSVKRKFGEVVTRDGAVFKDAFVDLRVFHSCTWRKYVGCGGEQ